MPHCLASETLVTRLMGYGEVLCACRGCVGRATHNPDRLLLPHNLGTHTRPHRSSSISPAIVLLRVFGAKTIKACRVMQLVNLSTYVQLSRYHVTSAALAAWCVRQGAHGRVEGLVTHAMQIKLRRGWLFVMHFVYTGEGRVGGLRGACAGPKGCCVHSSLSLPAWRMWCHQVNMSSRAVWL